MLSNQNRSRARSGKAADCCSRFGLAAVVKQRGRLNSVDFTWHPVGDFAKALKLTSGNAAVQRIRLVARRESLMRTTWPVNARTGSEDPAC